ncbi:hypothetical protein EXE59_15885 [Nocardioides eburneiflavus]|uniref:Uncharacterized protein n=1 Tax=Nocardioides eburneiflavus TaxID=2518372 RepID=A0A4Z1CKG6_9ACTN|nr:hypothetical protein [Nocardioides eburneiflavus]TGN65273.1 hypothetical protein EXE59_15885 [Nocardioides eburneiflavus]
MTQVPYPVIIQAARDWDEQADVLHSASRNLTQAEVAELGPRVAAAATRFVETWRTEIDAMEQAAISHSQALSAVRLDFFATDQQASTDLRDLVPWADR